MNSCIQRYDAGRVAIMFNVPELASVYIGSSNEIAGIARLPGF
jgi:hypothetical protein